jgi:hypothetical protein
MMIGIGTPSSQSNIPRPMDVSFDRFSGAYETCNSLVRSAPADRRPNFSAPPFNRNDDAAEAFTDRSNSIKESDMPKDAHNKAAEHHETAAKSHKMAAEHHGRGDHKKGQEESAKAQAHSKTAREHSDTAHKASQGAK